MEVKKKCKWCGKEFIAHSFNARFCSKLCADAAYKEKKRLEKFKQYELKLQMEGDSDLMKPISTKEFLTPTEAAKLLGISRATMYRYLATGAFKSYQALGKTIIRRSDIERAFDEAPEYKKCRNRRGKTPTSEYYTMKEIMEKYNITKRTVMRRCDRFHIPITYEGRNTYYNKVTIDRYFSELLVDFVRSEWYTLQEIMDKFHMTHGGVLTYVMRHRIPRLKSNNVTYYSKIHVDKQKKLTLIETDPDYYTIPEIMKKYNLSRDQVFYMLRKYDVPREKLGSSNRILRSDFDKAFRTKIGDVEVL